MSKKNYDENDDTSLQPFDKKKKIGDLDFLKSNIQSFLDDMDKNIVPPSDLLPGLRLDSQVHDYEQDLELIKEESKETLECISGLYLDTKTMAEKNISNIIRNDAETIGTIKFSIECAKRGLINCMKQLDVGVNDPEMHVAVGSYQKEIRDSNKMIYDLLAKMKIFYKELKVELKQDDINTSGSSDSLVPKTPKNGSGPGGLFIFDANALDDLLEEHRNNPTLLEGGTF